MSRRRFIRTCHWIPSQVTGSGNAHEALRRKRIHTVALRRRMREYPMPIVTKSRAVLKQDATLTCDSKPRFRSEGRRLGYIGVCYIRTRRSSTVGRNLAGATTATYEQQHGLDSKEKSVCCQVNCAKQHFSVRCSTQHHCHFNWPLGQGHCSAMIRHLLATYTRSLR